MARGAAVRLEDRLAGGRVAAARRGRGGRSEVVVAADVVVAAEVVVAADVPMVTVCTTVEADFPSEV